MGGQIKMRSLSRRLSPALVVSLGALFVALGGTSYAAFSLPKDSVGTSQLQNGAVTDKKVAKKLIVYGAKAAVVAAAAIDAEHADTADTATTASSATNADHATSADSATNAGNAVHATNADNASFAQAAHYATLLGSLSADELTRVAGTLHTTNLSAADGDTTIATISLTAPCPGFVVVNADVAIEDAPSTVPLVKVRVNAPDSGLTSWWHDAILGADPSLTGAYAGSVSASGIFPVTTGTQTYEIHGLVAGTGGVLANIDANAIFSPFGATGMEGLSAKRSAAHARQ